VTHGGDQGARVAIRLLQDAAERGEIDPWDVDVIAVIDGFLDQLRQTLDLPRQLAALGGSYEQGLAASSEAFLAASVLVALKAEHLEERTLAADQGAIEDGLEAEFDDGGDGDGWPARLALPARPERLLSRRPVAPPPQRRPVSLGELIRQLEDIASRLEQEAGDGGHRSRRTRRYSDREAIAQVAALAHREKLPETTAALALFLVTWEPAEAGCDFEHLVEAWDTAAPPDLDRDRVGVFWALLFLCAQGRVTLEQDPQDLFGSLRLTRSREAEAPLQLSMVAAGTPAETAAAA
jgi:segregation and condensation protein A